MSDRDHAQPAGVSEPPGAGCTCDSPLLLGACPLHGKKETRDALVALYTELEGTRGDRDRYRTALEQIATSPPPNQRTKPGRLIAHTLSLRAIAREALHVAPEEVIAEAEALAERIINGKDREEGEALHLAFQERTGYALTLTPGGLALVKLPPSNGNHPTPGATTP